MSSLVPVTQPSTKRYNMEKNEGTKGLKKLTKPNSIPMRMAKGGKELVRDTSKKRKYMVPGEKSLAQ